MKFATLRVEEETNKLNQLTKRRRWGVSILIAAVVLIGLTIGGTLTAGASIETATAQEDPAPG